MMSNKNTLDKVKIILDIDDDSKDDLLSIYSDNAKDYILDFTQIEEIPDTLQSVIVDMIVYQYRARGVENSTTESMGALYNSYMSEYPNNIRRRLQPYKRMLFL